MSAKKALLSLLLLWPGASLRAGDLGATLTFPRVSVLAPQGADVFFESGASAEPAEDGDTVLFHGEFPPAKELRMEVSRRLPDGSWGPWQSAYVQRYPNGRFWGKAEVASGRGSVRLRALSSARGARPLKIYSVEIFAAGDGEQAQAPRPAPPTPPRPRPLVHLRAQWHAAAPKEEYEPQLPERLTIHHTDGKYTTALEDTLVEVKLIQDFHIHGRGWNDIAYHYLIDAAGNIVEGRPEAVVGAHAGDHEMNLNNVGVVFLGTFHPPKNDPATAAMVDGAFMDLARYLFARYKLKPASLKGHRDFKSTDCPGDTFYAMLPKLRGLLAVPPGSVKLTSFRPLTIVAPRFD